MAVYNVANMVQSAKLVLQLQVDAILASMIFSFLIINVLLALLAARLVLVYMTIPA